MKIKLNTVDKVKAFCRIASTCEGDITIKSGRYTIDGKSIMGIFSLDLSKNLDVEFMDETDKIKFTEFAV